MQVVSDFYPRWQELTIHESSPGSRGASLRLAKQCHNYIPSQYFPDKTPGEYVGKDRCENLESLTFADESIDLHVSQDVLEHVLRPWDVFREVGRTLRPGGAHIFTVPIVQKERPSRLRVKLDEAGDIVHLEPPSYHGNPISESGSLVTVDWGYDICRHIFEASGLFTHIVQIDDLSKGIRAPLIDVLVTVKPVGEADELLASC